MATKVPSSKTPLPHESFFSGSNSGSRPYFDGPKIALCTPIRKTPASFSDSWSEISATRANDITAISNTFTPMVTERLLKRSARKPPAMEKRMNGRANSAPTTGINASRFSGGIFMPMIRKMTRFFSALSLNAPWNCVTNKLQKPRRDSRILDFWILD